MSAIDDALATMKSRGFAGERGCVIFEASDESGFHTIRVVEYHFSTCAHPVAYVEVEESADHSNAPARIYSFSAAVHALQNLRGNEVWEIGNREHGSP